MLYSTDFGRGGDNDLKHAVVAKHRRFSRRKEA